MFRFLALISITVSSQFRGSSGRTPIRDTAADISHWQPDPDWPAVIRSGIHIVIHKATQGLTYVDKSYAPRKAAARAAGLRYWGAYHFATGSDGAKQAEHFLKTAGDADFLAIDLEVNPTEGQTSVKTNEAEKLALAVHNATGRFPFVYGSPNFLNSHLELSKTLARCPLWLANWKQYPPNVPAMWDHWVLWQYTDGVHGPEPHEVPGIGNCDRDKVNTTAFLSYIHDQPPKT